MSLNFFQYFKTMEVKIVVKILTIGTLLRPELPSTINWGKDTYTVKELCEQASCILFYFFYFVRYLTVFFSLPFVFCLLGDIRITSGSSLTSFEQKITIALDPNMVVKSWKSFLSTNVSTYFSVYLFVPICICVYLY